jgi:Mn2+/Fe2+ NRAMP family transporter
MGNALSRIGPGFMLAATAVGVSHLVFSTQAGGRYGLSLALLIVAIIVLKYPAFRFAVDYSSATGRSLITGYARISRVALGWLLASFAFDMFFATGAVAMVTAGLLISVFGLSFSAPQVAVALMVITAAILINGQYSKAERIVKTLVLLFTILVVVATLFSLTSLGSEGRPVFAGMTLDRSLAVFVIAMAGWMPMPTNGAVMFSKWICEKRDATGQHFDRQSAMFDFKMGYGLTLVLALCFVVMGTAVLFETGREMPASPASYATELLGIFTTSIADWVYPVIAVAGIAVIWSTQVALMDVFPRVMDRLTGALTGRPDDAPSRFRLFLAIQVAGVAAILLLLMKGFTTFLFFTTSMGFIASPAIAYYNYRAVSGDDIAAEYRPTTGLVLWSWAGIFFLAAFAVAFLWTNLG